MMSAMIKVLVLCLTAATITLTAALPTPDTADFNAGDFSNTTSLVPRWPGGTCSFHATISQICFKEHLWQKTPHYAQITFTKGILDGAGKEIPNLRMGVEHINEPVKGHRRSVMDVMNLGIGYTMSIQGFADKVTLIFKWYEWTTESKEKKSKMTYEYGCQWDEDTPENGARCGGWCNRGAWSHTQWPCEDELKERKHEMDCYFKC